MLLQFQQDVIALHPTIVHFMSGINDLNTPVGTVLTRDNIASMVQLARAHGIKVVLASITPSTRFWAFPTLRPADEIRQLNAWLREFARNAGVTYVDYYEVLADRGGGLPSALTNDGLHPNSRGYALMTPIAERALARMQASR